MNRNPWLVLLFLILPAFLLMGCEPTPCLQPPVSTIGFAFYRDSAAGQTAKSFPASGLYLKQGGRFLDARQLLGADPQNTAITRIQVPFPNVEPTFEIGWATDSLRDSLQFSAESALLYGGESCGFYEGFRNLSLRGFGGNRIRRVALTNISGDTSRKIHVEVYW